MTLGFSGRQGFPTQTIHSGIDFVTTEHAPTTVPLPISMPGPTKTPDAIQHSDPISIGAHVKGI
jgi:hypothetical protein